MGKTSTRTVVLDAGALIALFAGCGAAAGSAAVGSLSVRVAARAIPDAEKETIEQLAADFDPDSLIERVRQNLDDVDASPAEKL